MSQPSTTVFYHQQGPGVPCTDGFAAAWVASQVLGRGPEVAYVPAIHGAPPPDPEPLAGQNIYVLDFAFPRAWQDDVFLSARSMTVIDHHATAQEELADRHYAHFDLSHSGAVLTFMHFHPVGTAIPEFLLNIEHRDLWTPTWREALETGGELLAFHAMLRSYPADFATWDHLAEHWDDDSSHDGVSLRESLVAEGEAILRYQRQEVEKAVRNVRIVTLLGKYLVPCTNCPTVIASEVGHTLLERYPDAPFSMSYYDQPQQRVFSLRSRPGGVEVNRIASGCFGGGGHPQAAGFQVPLDSIRSHAYIQADL